MNNKQYIKYKIQQTNKQTKVEQFESKTYLNNWEKSTKFD